MKSHNSFLLEVASGSLFYYTYNGIYYVNQELASVLQTANFHDSSNIYG